ncbi:MAG: zinc-ribbon domain-containing protein [Ruminococcaceae bacterium]|nr:zinc-ribbon domain-containing protein [Oscillospiraceae bacterium]
MFCPKCGAQLADGVAFCSSCGNPVTSQAAPAPQQPLAQPGEPALSMKWFKFLIYFGLWAGAVLNILLNGVMMLSGSQYGDAQTVELVYAMFGDLKSLDTLCGILAIVVGVLGIYTRFQLAGFKKNGPMLLTCVYAGSIAFTLIYIIGINSILPEYVLSEMDFSSIYGNIAGSVVMIFANITYFKKRAHLFVN